jgi:SpoIIAA-like
MIEIDRHSGDGIVVVRPRGVQVTSELIGCMESLLLECQSTGPLMLLFDWSEIENWRFVGIAGLPIRRCLDLAGAIKRVAIVHENRWNRQAAWFAAILRSGNAEVRSWNPRDLDAAMAWLKPKPESGLMRMSGQS